ncbi:MAG: glycosyltransferase family 4 protein [Candidatus Saccharibacteria bacterium]|nr:glycosyltransferase family 4 protein [Candidatus Saccharibacteria bacterium]
MKIGLVCPYDMFRGGGVQEHVNAQANELRRRGHTVIVITPRARGYKDEPPNNTIFVGTSAMVRTPISTNLELGASFERDSIDDMLQEQQFDVLHVHEPEVPMLGSQIIAKANCPVVATFHAYHPKNAISRTIEMLRVPYSRTIFSQLAAVTAVSDVAAEFVKAHTDHHVHIIPNGIDLSAYINGSKKRRANTVLYVGRLERRKGVIYLVRAFAKMADSVPNAKLIIAGQGSDLRKLQDTAHELGVGDQVEFLGYVDDKTKKRLMHEASLFCSPAIYGESFGIVLLEAMASGVPVVAGDNPGYVSVLQGKGLLSLVNPKDTTNFARRLKLFLQDDEIVNLWLDWANQHIQHYTYESVVDKYEKLYESIIK